MDLRPRANQTLTLHGRAYRVSPMPIASPDGADHPPRVLRLERDDKTLAVLKLIAPGSWTSQPALHAELISAYSQLPGLQATACSFIPYAELAHQLQGEAERGAIFMPWMGETDMRDLILRRVPLTPARSHSLALNLARTLAALEQREISHGALAPGHVVLADSMTAVELVSLDGLWAPTLPPQARPGPRPSPFAHAVGLAVRRQPEDDRFAGALLIALILGWCDPQVAAGGAGPDYFVHGELQSSGLRYNTLQSVLGGRWGGSCVSMFARAWFSTRPEDCPSAAEWAMLIEDLPIPVTRARLGEHGEAALAGALGALAPDERASALQQQVQARLEAGKELMASGKLDQAIMAFEEAYNDAETLAAPYLVNALAMRAEQSAFRGDVVAAQSDYAVALLVAPPGDLRARILEASAALSARSYGAHPDPSTTQVALGPPNSGSTLSVATSPDPAAASDEAAAVDPAEPDARPTPVQHERRRPLTVFAIVLTLGVLLCVSFFNLTGWGRDPVPSATPLANAAVDATLTPAEGLVPSLTGEPPTIVIEPSSPMALPQPSSTGLATTATSEVAPATPAPLQTPATPASPVGTPTLRGLTPATLVSDQLPITITISGLNLERITTISLEAPNLAPLSLGKPRTVAGGLEVQVQPLAQPLGRSASYTLHLDGVDYPKAVVSLAVVRQLSGLRAEFNNSPRISSDGSGLYTRMRSDPDVDSERVGLLRPADRVELLDNKVPGWYRVRVLTSAEPNQSGLEGWLERWLLGEGEPPVVIAAAPPAPTPAPRLRFTLLNYNDASHCISLQIQGVAAKNWYFKVDGLAYLAPGKVDDQGNARLCGLSPGQEVTISVYNRNNTRVIGGMGVPAKGSAILRAVWR